VIAEFYFDIPELSMQKILLFFLLTLGFFLNTATVAVAANCSSGTAQMTVTDGVMRRDCGCVEPGGVIFTGKTLVCTVPVGTRVYFDFSNIQALHQIVFSVTSLLLPAHDPSSDGNNFPVDAITLNTKSAGINFVDLETGNGGTFIVQ
jgi:hypothetical protein